MNRNLFKILFSVSILYSIPFAVPGDRDYMTFMARTFQYGWRGTLTAQWENRSDWHSEMDDVANRAYDHAGTIEDGLRYNFFNTTDGYNADLLVIDTHGSDSELPGPDFYGKICGYNKDEYLDSRELEPPDGELEIIIESACSTLSRDNWDMWYGFRNLFRRGAFVLAGCWSYCSLITTGINTTFNEVGDEIADGESTIYTAWREGADIGYSDDDIAVYGVGRVGASNCDDRARNVSLQNRNDYYEYLYGHDQPYSTSVNANEICGYYWTNY